METESGVAVAPRKYEGQLTNLLERRTSRVPTGAYLGLAFGSMVASAACMVAGRRHIANFIGQWVPSLLIIGLYNKLVKVESEMLTGFDSRRDRVVSSGSSG
jgi:hypothetical protein